MHHEHAEPSLVLPEYACTAAYSCMTYKPAVLSRHRHTLPQALLPGLA
jgi:hypothetical protein